MTNITIICDNGGGITLQLNDATGDNAYQHYYDGSARDIAQCAQDINAALAGDDHTQWDGNEAEDDDGNDQWLQPSDDDIRNGGYRVYDVDAIKSLDPDTAWGNARDLHAALIAGNE